MLLTSVENLESVIIYSVEQHLNLAHPSTTMQLKQAQASPPRGGEGTARICGEPAFDMALVMVLRPGGGTRWRHAVLSHTPGPLGASLAQSSWQAYWLQWWCLLVALSVVHPELELCSVREQNWLQFDERQKTRQRRFYVCVGGWGLVGSRDSHTYQTVFVYCGIGIQKVHF